MEDNKNTIDLEHQEQAAVQENASITDSLDPLIACKKEVDTWKEKYIRTSADLENFSKRVDKERVQWRTAGQSSILTGLLEIVDDFDRAFEQLNKANVDASAGSWVMGFELIHKALHKFLESHEVKEIATNVPFDTTYHEALMEVESADHQPGDIVAVLQKGYTFKGQVLRVAKVSVAK
jgi:molecular chaperone GrpE